MRQLIDPPHASRSGAAAEWDGMRLRVDTGSPDQARELLSASYCPHALSVSETAGPFRARQSQGGTNRLSVYRLTFGPSTAVVEPEPFDDFFLLSHPLSGSFSVAAEGYRRVLRPGQAVALDPATAYRLQWSEGCELLTIRLQRADVETAVASIRGTSRRPVRFPVETPEPRVMQVWSRVVGGLVRDLLPGDLLESAPLVQTEIQRLLISAVLQAYPSVLGDPGPSARTTTSHVVKCAVDFIEAAAGDDITLREIAAAAHVSPRALQEGFRYHLDTTPVAVLRTVRLRRAHAELLSADPRTGVTVSSVAARWGFSNLGRFARMYRTMFGVGPSDSLRA